MPILVMKFIFGNLQKQSPWVIKPIVNGICNKINDLYLGPNIRLHLDFLEGELGKRKWLAGEEFSGADIQVNAPTRSLTLTSTVHRSLSLSPGKFRRGNAHQTLGCR